MGSFFDDWIDPTTSIANPLVGGENIMDAVGDVGEDIGISDLDQRIWDPGNITGKYDSSLDIEQDLIDVGIADEKKVDTPAPPNPGVGGDTSQIDAAWAQANPREAQALLTREQWEYTRDKFLPIERQLGETVSESPDAAADRAGNITRRSFISGQKSFDRDLSRRGTALTTAQTDALARRRAISESKGIATAENVTRRTLDDRNRNLLGNLAGLGRGISTSAASAFGGAAEAAASREATGTALNEQRKQSKLGGAATGAGLGFQYGGAWGGLIGGGLGYLAG